MKRTSLYTGRFALTGLAAAVLYLTVPDAWALGLGRLNVQSALGENLRAEIDVTSLTPEEAGNLRIRIAPPESYRAAGVDYNAVLPNTQAVLARTPDGRPYLRLTSDRAVQEPFVDVILEISWNTGRLVREYTLLFDPPTRNMAQAPQPAPTTAPVIGAAPAPSTATAPAQSQPSTPSIAAAPAPRERRPAAPRPAAPSDATPGESTANAPQGNADEYRVKQGDTLSRIAGRTQRQGVSLDQMLVSLYRGNPQAFVENNMNRLKAGVVLSVPSADTAKAVTPTEAREVIQAQSADFGAYRQRLAGGVPDAKTEGSARQAGGKVEANVEDRKQAAAPTPDKLTLSKGAAGAKAGAQEEKIAREREKKDASTRVAELAKNVEDLKRLAGAASAPGAKTAAAPVPAATTKPGATVTAPIATPSVPTPPAAPPPVAAASVPAPKPTPVAPAPAPAPVAAAPVASAPVTAAAPTASAAVVAAAPTPPAASAPVVAARPPASAPITARAPAPPAEEPGMLASLFDDNPWALGLGAAVVALLAGFGIYRFSRRSKKDSGETSVLESRLQPDSFFGASGGQRIDTRDAGGASSSMSYSLSQLDAIGDVDPVAEADVYLAYGRDLQAEEILKEAMRSSPERLAIRTKLLEVYAKRRDTKGFELLATQLFSLTR
ncbi:MAG: FimV family protein, partial [Rhizobacter sp.]